MLPILRSAAPYISRSLDAAGFTHDDVEYTRDGLAVSGDLDYCALTRRPTCILLGEPCYPAALMAMLTTLAVIYISKLRRTDQVLGSFTYPLYLYHENVLVFVLTCTAGYSYGVFAGAMAASMIVAYLMTGAVDSLVNRYRDRVRGRQVTERRAGTARRCSIRARCRVGNLIARQAPWS
jgi:peptidoglycan/LPS O-acetylase OafA/YrhL